VEDLLPFFPDFTLIDEFKDAVLDELGRVVQVDSIKTRVESAYGFSA